MTTRLSALLLLLPLALAPAARAQQAAPPPGEERFGKGKLTVTNTTAAPVVAWFGKVELGVVPANGSKTFEKIPEGTRLIHVIAENRTRRWGPKDIYVTQQGGEWRVAEDATTGMMIVNNTAEDLMIYVADEESGVATANGGAFKILDVRVGNLKVAAKTASGKASYNPRFFEIKAGAITEWKIGRAAGAAPPPAETPAPAAAPEGK